MVEEAKTLDRSLLTWLLGLPGLTKSVSCEVKPESCEEMEDRRMFGKGCCCCGGCCECCCRDAGRCLSVAPPGMTIPPDTLLEGCKKRMRNECWALFPFGRLSPDCDGESGADWSRSSLRRVRRGVIRLA